MEGCQGEQSPLTGLQIVSFVRQHSSLFHVKHLSHYGLWLQEMCPVQMILFFKSSLYDTGAFVSRETMRFRQGRLPEGEQSR